MWLGVTMGLLAGLGHSLAYVATRWFTQDRGRPTGQLLVLSHVVMGVVSGAALPWLWLDGLGWDARWLGPYAGLIVFFVVAQCCLIASLRLADASRIAPLLGLKVALLAVLSVALGESLGWGQWAGVGLAVASALVLNGVGGRLPWRATALVVVACASYAVADTFIVLTVEAGRELSGSGGAMAGPMWCVAVVYFGIGVIAAALLPKWGSRSWGAWRDALPYSGVWLLGMVCLYTAFATLGTVLGAILQSTRGLMSIGLGVWLAHRGWQHLEQKHGAGVVWRRVGAAALMTAAVALYVMGGR